MNKVGRPQVKANRTPLLKTGLFILLSVAVSPLFAATQTTEQQKTEFIQLVKAGQLEQAYQLAEALELELAGDPDFDMAYGRIALHVGQNDRAVFALERVVAEKPQWQQARFTLAQAYYKTKNYPAALSQLDQLEKQPQADLVEPVSKLRSATEWEQTKLKGHQRHKIRYGFGHDDNVNSGTAEDRIFIPSLGEIDVFPQSRESSDNFHQLGYSFDGRWQQDQRYAWLADAQLGATKFNQLSEFDRETLAVRAGFEADYQQYSYSMRAYSRPLRLDGQLYRNDWGGQISGKYQMNALNSVGLQWVSGRSDNRIDDRLNLTVHALSASWERKGSRWINQATISVSNERSRLESADYNSRVVSSLSYSTIWLASASHILIARAELQDVSHKAAHPLFRVVRDEALFSFTASWIWQYSASFGTELRCSYTNKNSPVTLYEYDRTECVLGASYAF
ncbi:MAG: tetratricopeptide repeat protein [Gammaproteobacteria bacterium]|nr:tetratricopeptide repeat protein [Gammaproteobacteria bacterium]MBU2059559.1 tetratricopeptide repeat protein [Gammaproteobacteria bacterium]MBU2174406.1 tetratricopeptide repeat protein [Gammaproteobacteria bacterium]MBU2248031.1 tetratricopeptide repeat protein [Gammaproteobacteria bacterium]MBU2345501.1 tetratricopeptide repeat protein [Gammaproteobacteria bacterium]